MDIQSLIDMAKKRLVEDGGHPPILYAENKDGGVSMFYFADLPESTFEKQKACFALGREHGIDSPGNPIAHLYFVSEAWTSHNQEYAFPSDDPERKEALVINSMSGETAKMEGTTAEILRTGGAVTVLPVKKLEEVHNALLFAFMAGVASAKMSDRELANMIEKYAK